MAQLALLLAEALDDAHAGAGVGSTTEGPVDLRRHYANDYYGPPTVPTDGTSLSMSMGPPSAPETFALASFDGDTFTFQTIGENVTGKSGAAFTVGADGTATSVTLDAYDNTGLGTFTTG